MKRAALLLGLIAAPAAAKWREPRLPGPEPLVPAAVHAAPSAPVRGYAVSLADRPLTARLIVRLLCLADSRGGIAACLADTPAVPRGLGYVGFLRLAGGEERVAVDHGPVGLATLIARTYLLREQGRPRLLRVAVALDPADAARPAAGALQPSGAHTIEPSADQWRTSDLYPAMALRADTRARVRMRCRVAPDRSLACRDGTTEPATLGRAEAEAFVAASLQAYSLLKAAPALKSGGSAIGTEFDTVMRWDLPG